MREATEAFGRGECYAEQFLEKPRHIEAQIIADGYGHTVVLGTRDCSLQRRNQKLVEEAPAPFITDEQRARIHGAARAICAEAGYTGAGTVEFLLSQDGVMSFLEVNTRLQVEHPVTEETTGVDIVVEQLRIADGLPLSVTETPAPRGHAFEFRINAEDPGRGFLPMPGRVTLFRAPLGPGVRLDAGVESGSDIPSLYDSMMAKLIVTGTTRGEALARARRALTEFRIEGVPSVLSFHRAVVNEPDFVGENAFKVFTNWIETKFRGVEPAPRVDPVDGGLIRCFITIDGKRHELGLPWALFANAAAPQFIPMAQPAANDGGVVAPIPGTLQKWLVEDGATVTAGDVVALIEAMKMETRIPAPKSGCIRVMAQAGAADGETRQRRTDMKPQPITETPQDAAARMAIKPVICYPVETLARPNLVAYRALRDDLTLVERVVVPPREAACWTVPAGHFCRIICSEGPQVGDLNLFNANDLNEKFYSGKTRALTGTHVGLGDQLFSSFPYMRPMATITHDTLDWYGFDEYGGSVHDVIGTRCDPYTNNLLSHGGQYHHCCHSNLTRAFAQKTGKPLHKAETYIHDVLNVFMCTGFMRDTGQYFMKASPVRPGDYLELFAEIDLLGCMSACPGGDCSSEHSSDAVVCYPMVVEIYKPSRSPQGWTSPSVSGYDRTHG